MHHNLTAYNGTQAGGLAFLVANLAVYLPYTVLYGFSCLFGILGNVLIFATIIVTKELHNSTGILVFNLSLADILVSGFVDSMTVLGVLVGENYLIVKFRLCQFIGELCLISCIASLMNIGFLAFNRYIHICYHHRYSTIFTTKKTLIYCCVTWIVGFLITVPNLTGWGGYHYDQKTLECLWNRLASQSYSIFFPMSSIVIPCLLILFFYIRIFVYASSSINRVNAHESSSQSRSRELKKSIKIAKGLFGSFMLFTICWLPYGLVVMIDFGDKFPPAVHAYSMAIAHFNSSLNPILYAIANPAFQRGYKKLFTIVKGKQTSIAIERARSFITFGVSRIHPARS